MRVVAGEYRSRRLKTLATDHTRPTLDKVKEAVFSSIGPYFYGGSILDLFSGSGSIAIEFLSRGIDEAVVCDNDFKAISIIKENLSMVKDKQVKVYQLDYKSCLKRCENKQFDYIYVDPPFFSHYYDDVLEKISSMNCLKDNGVILCESSKEEIISTTSFVQTKEVIYGTCKITYFRKEVRDENSMLSR